MGKLLAGMIGALALAGGARAQVAQSVTYTSNSVADALLPYTQQINLKQFDGSMGTLQSIVFALYGDVSGSVQVENTSAEAEKIGLKLSAIETLRRPDGTTLVVVVPAVDTSANLSAFDGTDDYAGTSGTTITGLAGSLADSATFTDTATLALFTGSGSVASTLRAIGASQAEGNGNETIKFTTKAGGYAKVTYNYLTGAVPEPGTWLMMIAGFGFVGIGMRRRGVAPIFN